MTIEQVEKLNLGIDVIDAQTVIMVESALRWIDRNTNLTTDLADLSANVKLFIIKYVEVMGMNSIVSHESLGGMSQSFAVDANKSDLLLQYAYSLFGDEAMCSQMSFVSAKRRWKR